MKVCVFFGEGPAVELDIVAVEEVRGDVRRLIWLAGVLGVSGDIDASQHDLTPVSVSKLAILYL